jgi:hypothetical protein
MSGYSTHVKRMNGKPLIYFSFASTEDGRRIAVGTHTSIGTATRHIYKTLRDTHYWTSMWIEDRFGRRIAGPWDIGRRPTKEEREIE